ncbi:TenA family protein, partial [Cutibacterium granulosum]
VGGTLPDHAFRFYLGQDARYLQDYAKALAGLAARTDAVDETTYWSYSAYSSQVEEAELHRTWLAGEPAVAPSPVTQAYTNFLLASVFVDDYVVGAAAVLPCYWLYAQTGAQIPRIPDEHPYAAWLHTYHDDEFVQATAQALAIVERAFALAAPQARSRAARAYLTACRHEMEFFDQALRVDPDGPGCDE